MKVTSQVRPDNTFGPLSLEKIPDQQDIVHLTAYMDKITDLLSYLGRYHLYTDLINFHTLKSMYGPRILSYIEVYVQTSKTLITLMAGTIPCADLMDSYTEPSHPFYGPHRLSYIEDFRSLSTDFIDPHSGGSKIFSGGGANPQSGRRDTNLLNFPQEMHGIEKNLGARGGGAPHTFKFLMPRMISLAQTSKSVASTFCSR